VRAKIVLEESKVTSENVLGLLPGSDPALEGEYVLLSAHLDHVGVGEPINGDPIHNGAMDNASGTATIIEVARQLRESEDPPQRSILFLACTGEEKGLLGSKYYASRPTVDMNKVVANVNVDMFLPIIPLRMVRAFGLNETSFGELVQAAAAREQIQVQEDPEPERNVFIRSDQYNFIKKGVPSLVLAFGREPGSPEDKVMNEWRRDRYHAPADDLQQPVNKEAAAKYNKLMATLTAEIANRPDRPKWREDSFFRRFAEGRP
jgi:Zn-dependent M28 family amino/carboxypeptidase